MRATVLCLTLAAAAVACAPHMTPEQCRDLCASSRARVCEYSDDLSGKGLCVCSDEQGRCEPPEAGE